MTPILSDVIAECERAVCGSPELDAMIAEAIGWQSDRDNDLGFPPPWTRSLDAALPEEASGWWQITGPRKYLYIPDTVPNYWRACFVFGERLPYQDVRAWAATEPLARRSCALRARAILAEGETK